MVSKAVGNRKLCTLSAVLFITSIAYAKSIGSAYADESEQEGAFMSMPRGVRPPFLGNDFTLPVVRVTGASTVPCSVRSVQKCATVHARPPVARLRHPVLTVACKNNWLGRMSLDKLVIMRAPIDEVCGVAEPLSPHLLKEILYEETEERIQALGKISDAEGSLVRTFFSPAHIRAASQVPASQLISLNNSDARSEHQ